MGYLHIAAMDMTNFFKFEEQLYAAGAGKDGLVIDVRENGGGSTADHLMTALTQPVHAITVPRGGGPGGPWSCSTHPLVVAKLGGSRITSSKRARRRTSRPSQSNASP